MDSLNVLMANEVPSGPFVEGERALRETVN